MWEIVRIAGKFVANFLFAEVLLKGATWVMHHTRIKRLPDNNGVVNAKDAGAKQTQGYRSEPKGNGSS